MVVPLVAAALAGLAASLVAPEIGRQVSSFRTSEEGRKLYQTPMGAEVGREAYASVQQGPARASPLFSADLPIVGKLEANVQDLPGYGAYAYAFEKDRPFVKQFYSTARSSLIRRGYDPATASRLAQDVTYRELVGGGSGEAVGAASASLATEKLAQKLILPRVAQKAAQAAAQAGRALTREELASLATRTAIPRLAVAGGYEGATTYGTQAFARRQDIDPRSLTLSALLGGTSATVIGAPIVKYSFTKPKLSKGLTGLGYLVDPYEPIGDFGARVTSKGVKQRLARARAGLLELPERARSLPKEFQERFRKVRTPSLSPTQTEDFVSERAKTQLENLSVNKRVRSPRLGRVVSFVPSFTPTYTPSNTPSQTPSQTSSNTPEETPTGKKKRSPSGGGNTPSENNTPTETNTPSFTPSFVPTPTILPRNLILPFIPPIDDTTGRVPIYTKKGLIYLDELERARQLLRRFL